MNVTVFGSSQPKPADPDYEAAMTLGQLLGSDGHTVLTGGYIGTMEAVSRGASTAGAHVIGVTCDQIETFRPGKPNHWVKEERRYKYLYERIIALIEGCDAAIALPGGPGTLTEISTMWNLLLIGAISFRPLILIGSGWEFSFNTIFYQMDKYIPGEQRRWLSFAPDIDRGYARLSDFYSALAD
jgi:uncharacterized protein (TIGR00725 family)